MPEVPCPDAGTVRRLLLGLVPEAEAGPLEEHFLDCPSCAPGGGRPGAG